MNDDMTIESLKHWLASWGDGPNWSDATGATIPIHKDALRRLLDEHEALTAENERLRISLAAAERVGETWRSVARKEPM